MANSLHTHTRTKNPLNKEIRFLDNFKFAFKGIFYVVKNERNIKIHIVFTILVVLVSLLLKLSPVEFAVILLTVMSVIVAEMFNTVIEVSIDLVTNEYHQLAEIAKDVAAGAVLITSITSVVIGALIFMPHILSLLQR